MKNPIFLLGAGRSGIERKVRSIIAKVCTISALEKRGLWKYTEAFVPASWGQGYG